MATTTPGAAEAAPTSNRRRSRYRTPGIVAATFAAVVATAFGVSVLWEASRSDAGAGNGAFPTSLATVTLQTLSSNHSLSGVVQYPADYRVWNFVQGVVTNLPGEGDVVAPGQVLFSVSGTPVVLLEGEMPAYRALEQGVRGADVAQLNASLAALGYGVAAGLDAASDEFSAATASAIRELQLAVGAEPTGMLPLGHVVFLPGPARVTSVEAALGAPVQPGAPILRAGTTVPIVTVDLDPAHQSAVSVGDPVRITLPDRQVADGTVTFIGSVAAPSGGGGGAGGGGGSRPAIPVVVSLAEPAAAGALDQVPVSVSITTAVVEDVLVVPVTALLALAGGGHAVEVAFDNGSRSLIPVTTGLFDSSRGLVEVSGEGLAAGMQVVVPGRGS